MKRSPNSLAVCAWVEETELETTKTKLKKIVSGEVGALRSASVFPGTDVRGVSLTHTRALFAVAPSEP